MIENIDISVEGIQDVISHNNLTYTPLVLIVEISYKNMMEGLRVIQKANESLNSQGYYFHPKVRTLLTQDEWGVYTSDGSRLFHTFGA